MGDNTRNFNDGARCQVHISVGSLGSDTHTRYSTFLQRTSTVGGRLNPSIQCEASVDHYQLKLWVEQPLRIHGITCKKPGVSTVKRIDRQMRYKAIKIA
jgi:hypothetical protein